MRTSILFLIGSAFAAFLPLTYLWQFFHFYNSFFTYKDTTSLVFNLLNDEKIGLKWFGLYAGTLPNATYLNVSFILTLSMTNKISFKTANLLLWFVVIHTYFLLRHQTIVLHIGGFYLNKPCFTAFDCD